jgi:hypothetical protein
MASFSFTPEMASSTATSKITQRRNPSLFTIFYEENTLAPTTKLTRSKHGRREGMKTMVIGGISYNKISSLK